MKVALLKKKIFKRSGETKNGIIQSIKETNNIAKQKERKKNLFMNLESKLIYF